MPAEYLPTAPLQILVVEDTAAHRLLLSSWLDSWGDRYCCASSLAEASALLAAGRVFDVALLDRHLPDGDGAGLLPLLRRCAVPRVLAMTTVDGPADQAQLRSRGFDGVLAKPLAPERLRAALRGLDGAAEEDAPALPAEFELDIPQDEDWRATAAALRQIWLDGQQVRLRATVATLRTLLERQAPPALLRRLDALALALAPAVSNPLHVALLLDALQPDEPARQSPQGGTRESPR
ncbi:response regulator [Chitinimonas koreensis]|uniref:response regulator n=1 Tax=Chitinimonas koreensis TaxID=356302 RepID=UPI00040B9840|nr:response regulator [Chitinimonas koreensis]QNM98714.1 response regulator transcription factor [Chitinimonas koreensis]